MKGTPSIATIIGCTAKNTGEARGHPAGYVAFAVRFRRQEPEIVKVVRSVCCRRQVRVRNIDHFAHSVVAPMFPPDQAVSSVITNRAATG